MDLRQSYQNIQKTVPNTYLLEAFQIYQHHIRVFDLNHLRHLLSKYNYKLEYLLLIFAKSSSFVKVL